MAVYCSYAPISTSAPWGRSTPSISVAGAPVDVPVSMQGDDGWRRRSKTKFVAPGPQLWTMVSDTLAVANAGVKVIALLAMLVIVRAIPSLLTSMTSLSVKSVAAFAMITVVVVPAEDVIRVKSGVLIYSGSRSMLPPLSVPSDESQLLPLPPQPLMSQKLMDRVDNVLCISFPEISASLSHRMQFFIIGKDESFFIPPPEFAEFPLNVQFVKDGNEK